MFYLRGNRLFHGALLTSTGIHRHGDNAIPSSKRYGRADREVGTRVHPVCTLQQGKRTALAGLQRENGARVWMELPHIAH